MRYDFRNKLKKEDNYQKNKRRYLTNRKKYDILLKVADDCRSGGTGRRTGLKIPRANPSCRFDPGLRPSCRFDPGLRHQVEFAATEYRGVEQLG